ncbi:lysophospholipase [Saccharopolyspora taberi]|uniref:Lysophospholipase n=1 Tax=Saccharopolyspora taberi TaxID=60895 RepID=A0ABN3V298_9PSEU
MNDVASWNEPDGLYPRGTFVLAVGRGESPAVYERLGLRLSADAYRVRVVSDATAAPDAVTTRLKELFADETDPAPRVLAGSDTGALLALRLAAQRTITPHALVLAGLPGDVQAPHFPSWEEELAARTSCPTHQRRLTENGGGTLQSAVPPQWHDAPDISGVTVPVLGLHGSDDVISPRSRIRHQYARLPHSRLVSVEGGKHDVLNDAGHRSVAAEIVLFLEELRRRGRVTRNVDISVERGIARG